MFLKPQLTFKILINLRNCVHLWKCYIKQMSMLYFKGTPPYHKQKKTTEISLYNITIKLYSWVSG